MITGTNLFLAIMIMSIVTMFTRSFPFILFDKNNSSPPKVVTYLGKYLPPAIISCILVYCFRDINFKTVPFGLREVVSAGSVAFLYIYKKNSMLSIAIGTIIYMIFTYYYF